MRSNYVRTAGLGKPPTPFPLKGGRTRDLLFWGLGPS